MSKPLLFALLATAACASPPRALYSTDPGLRPLAWLAGSWVGEDETRRWEEHWTPAAGRTMFGVHRDIAGGSTRFFEYLRIERREDGIFYVPAPMGKPAEVAFELVESGRGRAVFVNEEHDFPRRFEFRLDQKKRLHLVADDGGDPPKRREEWVLERAEVRGSRPDHRSARVRGQTSFFVTDGG